MVLTKANQQLVQCKHGSELDFMKEKKDVVGLVGKHGNQVLHILNQIKKGISHRGWGPRVLNYQVLLHPEIISSKPGQKQSLALPDSQVDPDVLNLSGGITAFLIDRTVIHKNKE